jgi:heme iron utilization protein
VSSPRQHNSGPDTDGPPVPEPTHAERAKTLVHLERTGSLSTLSRKQTGWPFGSVMPYAPDNGDRPIFLISTMAMHTQNLLGDQRASLLVTPSLVSGDPLGAARVTLMGLTTKIPKEEAVQVRERYLARHANASYWVDFNDFAFFRMSIADVYFVGGFGSMGWVAAEDYETAGVDPLADESSNLIKEINQEQGETLLAIARILGNEEAQQAMMTALDRLGFHLRIKSATRMQGGRIAFPGPVNKAQEVKGRLSDLASQVREGNHPLHSL